MIPSARGAEVCLVQPPYGPVERPSIGLGLLQAALASDGISADICHANIEFAGIIEPDFYYAITLSPNEELVGEWTFALAAFPEFRPDAAPYLALVRETFERLSFTNYLVRRNAGELEQVLLRVREQAQLFIDELAARIVESRPRIVGCSSTFQQHCASLALLRRVKQLDPQVVTLLGGANCEGEMGLATHESFPWLDVVVSGEAERLIAPLVRGLLDHGLAAAALPQGVIGPSRARRPLQLLGQAPPAPRAVVEELDLCPDPSYEGYFAALAGSGFARFVERVLLIETSRGCWWGAKHHCTFCGLNGHGMGFRAKSAERVLAEIERQSARYGVRQIEAVDNILAMPYIDSVMPALAKAPERYEIFFEIKSNLRRDQLEKLADAGVCWVQPGIESLHDEALKAVDKGCTALMNIQYLRHARELGIRSTWNLLYGLPGEPDSWYSEMADLVPLIEHLQPPDGFTRVQYHRFSPYHERPQGFGIRLTPARGYRHVYPLPEPALMRLAYFFEDGPGSVRERYPAAEEGERRPGVARLRAAISLWRRQWWAGVIQFRPTLSVARAGGRLLFYDSRRVSAEREFELDGPLAAAYRACSEQRSLAGVLGSIEQETVHGQAAADVPALLEELVRRKLVVVSGSRYLGLALEKPYRPFLDRIPIGHFNVVGYRSERAASSPAAAEQVAAHA